MDHTNKPAVAQQVTILTQTDGHPTSTNFPLSPTEVDHPVRSIAEYMLASEKIRWKNEYEYVTGLAFSISSCSSFLSKGNSGFPEPSPEKLKSYIMHDRYNSYDFVIEGEPEKQLHLKTSLRSKKKYLMKVNHPKEKV